MLIETKLTGLGYTLPEMSPPGALYTPVKQVGNVLYVSGQIPWVNGVPKYTGKVGGERDIAYGQEAARLCILNMLAALKDYLGDLDKIKQVVRIYVVVNSVVGFTEQHLVANGASGLLISLFGAQGSPARMAVGTNQLPLDVTVEIEGIFEAAEPSL